ncbi:MAG: NUDIX domain-containing protein [Candidatus Diapherotrites archaeon]|uniref:NUDIX domain-containing protein n=1 Tax=Candidatus Iainarchaeum sp. TaxID=3101447 RepID=A0A8T4L6N0_9ARCH|nr:NUDIX domain-containing protein [Candidatus Diapherotrites archaeon]
MPPRHRGTAIVRDWSKSGHRFLVVRGETPNKQLYILPGGRVEPGETGAQAAKRELYEELHLRALTCRYLFDYLDAPYVLHKVFFIRAKDTPIQRGHGIAAYDWHEPGKRKIHVSRPTKKIIEQYLKK